MPAINKAFEETATLTATSTRTVFGGDYPAVDMRLNVTAASGTTPTLSLQLQKQGEDNVWANIGPAIAATAVSDQTATIPLTGIVSNNPHNVLRLVHAVGGTSPSFTSTVTLTAKGA